MNAYLSDKPILSATKWRRVTISPSSNTGHVNAWLENGTQLSVRPDGSEETGPHGSDGAWEQAKQIGNRLVYDYAGIATPVVYDLMVMG